MDFTCTIFKPANADLTILYTSLFSHDAELRSIRQTSRFATRERESLAIAEGGIIVNNGGSLSMKEVFEELACRAVGFMFILGVEVKGSGGGL